MCRFGVISRGAHKSKDSPAFKLKIVGVFKIVGSAALGILDHKLDHSLPKVVDNEEFLCPFPVGFSEQ